MVYWIIFIYVWLGVLSFGVVAVRSFLAYNKFENSADVVKMSTSFSSGLILLIIWPSQLLSLITYKIYTRKNNPGRDIYINNLIQKLNTGMRYLYKRDLTENEMTAYLYIWYNFKGGEKSE